MTVVLFKNSDTSNKYRIRKIEIATQCCVVWGGIRIEEINDFFFFCFNHKKSHWKEK